jgi:hypothetical protein
LATPAVEEIEGGEFFADGLEASVDGGDGEWELIGGDVGWVGVWVGDPIDELELVEHAAGSRQCLPLALIPATSSVL